MSLDKVFQIASTGLSAQRLRVQLIASNLANTETTRTAEGGPYRKKDAVFQEHPLVGKFGQVLKQAASGVKVSEVKASQEPFIYRYQPGHPEADANGMVAYPNVNPVEEMVNLTSAARSYEANVAVVRSAKTMANSALEILRTQ